MEKTLFIDGKQVNFKSNGSIPLRYKMQFGKDFFADIMKMMKKDGEVNPENIDFETFYNLAWVFAKAADKSIPAPLEWLETFESFPLIEIIGELEELLLSNLESKKK